MPKIIILSVIMLIGSLANADITYEQRVCVSIDRNAHDSRWTTRDNTAKIKYLPYYNDSFARGMLSPNLIFSSHSQIEIHYGQAPVCETLYIHEFKKERWLFSKRITVGLGYGGDCTFSYNGNKTVNVTIHHRRGNLIEPWSCTTR